MQGLVKAPGLWAVMMEVLHFGCSATAHPTCRWWEAACWYSEIWRMTWKVTAARRMWEESTNTWCLLLVDIVQKQLVGWKEPFCFLLEPWALPLQFFCSYIFLFEMWSWLKSKLGWCLSSPFDLRQQLTPLVSGSDSALSDHITSGTVKRSCLYPTEVKKASW